MFGLGSRHRGLALLLATAVAVFGLAGLSVVKTVAAGRLPTGVVVFRTLADEAGFASGSFGPTRWDSQTPRVAAALVLDSSAGLGEDYDSAGIYNGGSYSYGSYTSPVFQTGEGVDSVVASWAADTPDGTWIEVDARALTGGTWTKYYSMGVWASGTATVQRHSSGLQEDVTGRVEYDTLRLKQTASAVQLRAVLFTVDPGITPRIRRLSVVAAGPGSEGGTGPGGPAGDGFARGWGVDLPVPERRQNSFPDGAGWCSPTSLSMLMAYWAGQTGNGSWDVPVPDTAAGVKDYAYGGTGNWVFNTAFAASLGLDSYLTRMQSLSQVEPWIEAGVPVAINITFGPGGLDGAPMPSSEGHIIVVRGFAGNGDPIANDPASRDDQGEKVRIVYDRAQFEKAWQEGSGGAVYILYPPGHATPR